MSFGTAKYSGLNRNIVNSTSHYRYHCHCTLFREVGDRESFALCGLNVK